MKRKTLIRTASLLLAITLTAGCSSSSDSNDTQAASADESSAVQTDETAAETSADTKESETTSAVENDIIEKREVYADGWYSIFRYNSDDKSIISADCFNSNDERVLAAEYKYKDDGVTRSVLFSDQTAVDFTQTYDMTRLDKNHAESYSSELTSTAKNMAEDQELTTVTDDNGVLTEAYYSMTLDDGTQVKTEQWKFSDGKIVYYTDGNTAYEYRYDDNGRISTELSDSGIEVDYSYELNEFGDPAKRTMTRFMIGSDDSNEFTTEYTFWRNNDNMNVYVSESTEYFGEIRDRLTGSEYDENGLPMRCIIHGDLTYTYEDLVYGSNPAFITYCFYVPDFDGTARIDELTLSLQCENK